MCRGLRPATVESVIMKLENDWVKAIVKKDLVTLGAVLADETGTEPRRPVGSSRIARIADKVNNPQ